MTDSHEEASWDALARFAERRFEGVAGQVSATVDGTLSVSVVRVGRFEAGTAESIRSAINQALLAARSALAKHLAATIDPDLPPRLLALLEGAAAPEDPSDWISEDFEATRAGVAVLVDGNDCLIERIVVPSAAHLDLLPAVANAALNAAESRRSVPLNELFDSSWHEIIAQLDDLDGRLDAILAEPGNQQD
ncbi:MAG: hypothetical protein GX596_09850 [Propionibacterium sp.]|nr:hypothetical protein [Propionibacterium sp.]